MNKPMEHTVDRTGWPRGPWDDEPNRVDFRAHGLPCFLLRSNTTGTWCGYAGLPAGGAMIEPDSLAVHGGVTYSGRCDPPICHVPEPGESDDVFWYGFDCAHAFDLAPGLGRPCFVEELMRLEGCKYRDVAYARAETEALAAQLAEFIRRGGP